MAMKVGEGEDVGVRTGGVVVEVDEDGGDEEML